MNTPPYSYFVGIGIIPIFVFLWLGLTWLVAGFLPLREGGWWWMYMPEKILRYAIEWGAV